MEMDIKQSKHNDVFVSVIMANFNTPIDYLKEAIDSILNQTYEYFELIIVDDGSTDSSFEFIKEIKDKRIVLLKNVENRGAAYARNRALDIAKGKYIAIMDSDDISEPKRFEKQVEYLETHPNVIVCASWATVFGDNIKSYVLNPKMPDMSTFKVSLLFGDNFIANPTVMMNRILLEKYHIRYVESFIAAQDYRMWVDCVQYGDFAILPEPLVRRRMHSKATTAARGKLQQYFRFKTIGYQLYNLHFNLSEESKIYYNCLYSPKKIYDLRTKEIILELIYRNKEYNIYSQKALTNYLWHRWAIISCYGLKKRGVKNKFLVLSQMPFSRYHIFIKELVLLVFDKAKTEWSKKQSNND